MRNFFALVLILIGAALTFPAAVAYWERNELMDEQRFVAVGNDVLARDEVQAAIARKLSQEVVAETGVPEIVANVVAARVVSNLPNSPAAEQALRFSYLQLRGIVRDEEDHSQRDRIVLLLDAVAQQIRVDLAPEVGYVVLPEGAGQIEIVQSGELSDALRIVRWFDDVAWYIALLPLAVFAVALLVASNRGLILAMTGFLLALTSLARIAVVKSAMASLLTDAVVSDDTTRAAATAAYNVISDTFVRLDVLVLAVGVALVVFGVLLSILRRLISPLD